MDSLPTNPIAELHDSMWDDSLIPLHAIEWVLGVNKDIDSDLDTSTEDEDKSMVCY